MLCSFYHIVFRLDFLVCCNHHRIFCKLINKDEITLLKSNSVRDPLLANSKTILIIGLQLVRQIFSSRAAVLIHRKGHTKEFVNFHMTLYIKSIFNKAEDTLRMGSRWGFILIHLLVPSIGVISVRKYFLRMRPADFLIVLVHNT